MMISEFPERECGSEYNVNTDVSREQEGGESFTITTLMPEAALWIIRPEPSGVHIRENTKTVEERQRRESTRHVKFRLAARTRKYMKQRARIHARNMRSAVKNNFLSQNRETAVTFHSAMKLMVVLGQIFGLNPVLGVTGKDATNLRFTYISWRYFYSVVSLMGQFIMAIMCINRCFKEKFDFSSGTSVVFYTTNSLTTAIFLRVARRWPELCRHISRTEIVDNCLDRRLVARCNVTVVLIFCASLVEHVFAVIAGIGVALDCYPNTPLYEAYNVQAFPWVFNYVPYSNLMGFISEFVNLQLTFNWNFTDLFAICISFYLTSRLEQINKRIAVVRGKYMPTWFWRRVREDYCRVTQLVRRVDNVISAVIFVSFANNLYFICLQLFNTLEDGIKGTPHCRDRSATGLFRGYEHAVYFVYSFVYLMARSLAVSLLVARVHSAARGPAPALYDVPSPVYCVEVQRFVEQVNGDNVALSGLQFFNVTRGLVLTVAGTIVTYELVLVQFNATGSSTTPSASSTLATRTTTIPANFT